MKVIQILDNFWIRCTVSKEKSTQSLVSILEMTAIKMSFRIREIWSLQRFVKVFVWQPLSVRELWQIHRDFHGPLWLRWKPRLTHLYEAYVPGLQTPSCYKVVKNCCAYNYTVDCFVFAKGEVFVMRNSKLEATIDKLGRVTELRVLLLNGKRSRYNHLYHQNRSSQSSALWSFHHIENGNISVMFFERHLKRVSLNVLPNLLVVSLHHRLISTRNILRFHSSCIKVALASS